MKLHKGFDKDDSLFMKGIAILLMLFHHLFLSQSRFKGYDVSFVPFGRDFVVCFADMLKICVSIFAFISGYGLYNAYHAEYRSRKETTVWIGRRLIKLWTSFFFCYVICCIVSLCFTGEMISTYYKNGIAKGIISNIIDAAGLARFFSTPTLNSTWWYISAAILYITVFPIVYLCVKKTGYFPIILLVLLIPRFIGSGYPGGTNPIAFMPPYLLGIMCADYRLFERVEECLKNRAHPLLIVWTVSIIWFVLQFIFNAKLKREEFWDLEFTVLPIGWIFFINYGLGSMQFMRRPLIFLGKHSMTIFMTHTIIRRYIYFNNHFLLIFLIMFISSFTAAVVIDWIKKATKYDRISEVIFRRAIQ